MRPDCNEYRNWIEGPLADWELELMDGTPVTTPLETTYKVATTMGREVASFSVQEWSNGAEKAFKSLNRMSGYNFLVTRVTRTKTVVTTYNTTREVVDGL